MGKLRFYHGCMSSMKTSTLILKQHQFRQTNQSVLVLKPSFDTRDENVVRSRALKETIECTVFSSKGNLYDLVLDNYDGEDMIIFVDEVSFITKEQVKQLWWLTRDKLFNFEVFAYGLKNTYKNELFGASEQLLIMADTIEEIKSMCCHCNNKATTHLRYVGDNVTLSGDSCIVGDIHGQERYESVCMECWHKLTQNKEETK